MWQTVLLVPTLFTIIFMSDVHVAMEGDPVMRRATGQNSRLERAAQPMKSVWDRFPTTLTSKPKTMGQQTHRPEDIPPAVPVDVDAPPSIAMDLSSRHPLEGSAQFPRLLDPPADTSEHGPEDLWLVEDEPSVADDESAAPNALVRDWRGLGRDTAFFVGYEAVAAGILYVLP